MKKLRVIALLAIFVIGCAKPGLEEHETEFNTQAIENEEVGEEDHEEFMEGDPDRNSG